MLTQSRQRAMESPGSAYFEFLLTTQLRHCKRPACGVLRRGAHFLQSRPLTESFCRTPEGGCVTGSEIITRRRKWKPAEKAALLAEVEAEGGKVVVVARRHGISESLLYNWRSARKATAPAMFATAAPVDFVPLGIFGPNPNEERQPQLTPPERERLQHPRAGKGDAGMIEIALPNGALVCVDALVNEKALSRVLRAMRNAI